MTAAAIGPDWLLIFPMTVEARIMSTRHRLEWMQHRRISILRRQRYDGERQICLMTDRTIVVVRFLVVERHRLPPMVRFDPHRRKSAQTRNHILMLVVWKLDRELSLVFCPRLLICVVRFAEGEARLLAWRCMHVTDDTDCRAGSNHCPAREELLPMTTHASLMVGKVSNVGKVSSRSPRRRNLVTLVAPETHMFFG